MFLADDAPFSLSKYQIETINDKDVKVTPWHSTQEGDAQERTLSFLHPIKNSTGFGPDSAVTNRTQTLRKFPDKGMCLDNVTRVEGIPSADSFHVQDRWVVESIGAGSQVRLTARYSIRFTKRALLKSLIQKSIRKETKEWWQGYIAFMSSAVDQDKSNGSNVALKNGTGYPSLASEDAFAVHLSQLKIYFRNLLCVVVALFVAMQLMLWREVVLLKQEVIDLKGSLVAANSEVTLHASPQLAVS